MSPQGVPSLWVPRCLRRTTSDLRAANCSVGSLRTDVVNILKILCRSVRRDVCANNLKLIYFQQLNLK